MIARVIIVSLLRCGLATACDYPPNAPVVVTFWLLPGVPSELSRSSGSAPGQRDAPGSPSDGPLTLADPKPSSWCTPPRVSMVPRDRY